VGALSQTDAFTPFSTTSNGEFKQAQKEKRKSNVGWVYDVSAKTKQEGIFNVCDFFTRTTCRLEEFQKNLTMNANRFRRSILF
jgi:hypothetical protein